MKIIYNPVIRVSLCLLSLSVATLFSPWLFGADVVVDDEKNITLEPTKAAGEIDLVTLKLPDIDASALLATTVKTGATHKDYKFTNAGDKDVVLCVYPLYKSNSGIFINSATMDTLKPGESHEFTATYRNDNASGRLYGEYRVVIAAFVYKDWGDTRLGTRTAAGQKVDKITDEFEKRVKESEKLFN